MQLQPHIQTVTADGTVLLGKTYIEFIFSSDFVGTINGVAFTGAADSSVDFAAIHTHTLGALKYTISAGSARLITF